MLAVRTRRRIEWGDCDPAGIIFNPRIMGFFDHGTTLLYRAAGWSKSDLVNQYGIVGCPVVKNSAEYYVPIRFDDTIEIKTEVSTLGKTSFLLLHSIYRGNVLCVRGEDRRVWAAIDKKTGAIRSRELPEDVRQSFSRGSEVMIQ